MHPLTLRFEAVTERAFREDAFPRALPQLRAAFLVGGTLILLAGGAIALSAPRDWPLLVAVATLVALANFGVVTLSHTRVFRTVRGVRRVIQATPFLAWAAGGAALIALFPAPPIVVSILMGQIVVMIYAFVFTRIGFVDANYSAWVMLAAVLGVALAVGGEVADVAPLYAFHTFNGYLSAALAGYFIERYIRRDFLLRRAVDAQRAESERLRLDLEKELDVGRRIQKGFLPETLPTAANYDIQAAFEPARQVAGDFYDAFPLRDGRRIALVVGDVCDKGVGAALFMALFRTLLRVVITRDVAAGEGHATAPGADGPAEALSEAVTTVNDYIAEHHERANMFVTLFVAVLDPESGELVYVNAGHDPPALAGPEARPARLDPTGPAVGLMPGMRFRTARARLETRQLLLVFTDGLTDARAADGSTFGEDRLLRHLARRVAARGTAEPADRSVGSVESGSDTRSSATAVLASIEADLADHTRGAEQFDDVTLLAVERRAETTADPELDGE